MTTIWLSLVEKATPTAAAATAQVRLGAISGFGEGALVTEVKREATVTAIEPCKLMLLTADDMEGIQRISPLGYAVLRD